MTAQVVRRWPQDVPVHPAAELFPLMAGEHFQELVQDIRANGLIDPIVRTPEEEILDGRNRLLACAQANKPVRFVTYTGDPWRFVISTNLHRRHLTDTQRAIIAGKLADRVPGRPQEKASYEAFSPAPPTRSEAAGLLQVSRTAVERARRLQHSGTPALNEITEAGQVRLSTAERVATRLPPEEQDDFVRRVQAGVNPITAAPPESNDRVRPEQPARARSRPSSDTSVITANGVSQLAQDMSGIELAMKTVTSIDPDITAEQRAMWGRAIGRGVRALVRLRKLIKEVDEKEVDEGEEQP